MPAQRRATNRLRQLEVELMWFRDGFCQIDLVGKSPDCCLLIALSNNRMISVSIEEETDFFLVREFGDAGDEIVDGYSIFLTSDLQRVLDFVCQHILKDRVGAAPSEISSAIGKLVGHSVANLERHLILQTFRSVSGDRHSAARILGLPPDELSRKLRDYVGLVRAR